MSPLIRLLRTLSNGAGLAWWARVQSSNPDVTYWFGPFIRKQGLSSALPRFLDDLSQEQPGSISHAVLRCRRAEPLTISTDG
ncbi:MAG: DUF1816 domain-containing protein [Prochlorococcus sp.]|jgi:hypothetical protein|nr:DUF1816 domain-containing protein [Prochlorococcaceae cyanobacterium Fu_MAG_50]